MSQRSLHWDLVKRHLTLLESRDAVGVCAACRAATMLRHREHLGVAIVRDVDEVVRLGGAEPQRRQRGRGADQQAESDEPLHEERRGCEVTKSGPPRCLCSFPIPNLHSKKPYRRREK